MISENENPASGTNNANPNNANSNVPASGESAMSILEKRLAEINARKNAGSSSAETTPTPAPAPVVTPEIRTEPVAAPIIAEETKPEASAPEITIKPVKTETSETSPSETPHASTSLSGTTETTEVMGGTIAAREVILPVVIEGSVLHENRTDENAMDSGQKPESTMAEAGFPVTQTDSESISAFQNSAPENINTEDVYRPNVSDLPDIDTRVDNNVSPELISVPDETDSRTFTSETNTTGTETASSENQTGVTNSGVSSNFFVPAGELPEDEKITEAERDATLGDENSVGNVISGAIAAREVIPEITPAQRQESEKTTGSGTQNANFEDASEEELHTEADYSGMSADELGVQVIHLVKTTDNRKNGRQIIAVYREYEAKLALEKNDAQQRFLANGGVADDFEFRLTPERQAVEKAMQNFRENRQRDFKSEEEQKQKNLQRKQELLAELRTLIEGTETKASSDRIKAIQEEWKTIGPVPQSESQQLWNSYHALLDIFYNNRGIFNELKDLDRKRNLAAKEALIARAEALVQNPSINESLNELKHLHEEWKNIGPVPNDQRDPVWERFLAASEKVHDRKKEFLAGRRVAEQENLLKKTEVLQRLEFYENYNTDRINDWRDKTEEIQKMKAEWDALGLVPKENADQINKRFWGIYKQFFNQKNAYFKALDDQKMANLKLKTELCERAEAIKDSDDWDTTKEELIRMQKQWKTIGRVPDKYSEKIWERFRAACNAFFDRKQAELEYKEQAQEKISAEKTNYLTFLTQEIGNPENKVIGTLDELYAMEAKWRSFDAESQRPNPQAEEKFYGLMEKYLDTVPELSYDEKNAILFKLQMDKLKNGPDAADKIRQKEQSLRKEIGQLENDIRTLNTNIEFFARSKNAAQLREEYQQRTDEAQKRIDHLQKQLKALRA